jgi:hypothetical protein
VIKQLMTKLVGDQAIDDQTGRDQAIDDQTGRDQAISHAQLDGSVVGGSTIE